VASNTSTRIWRTNRSAGRPWPQISWDPVTDYMIMEAVSMKIRKEDNEAAERKKRNDFKQDFSGLDQFR
jgi:hypothetical protein